MKRKSSPKPSYRDAADQRVKREELKTYRELELKRDLKSARQRKRLEAGGVRRVLGDGSSGQPYLVVETRRYRVVRLEIQRTLLEQARQSGLNLPADLLLRQLKPRIEAMTYAQLAEESSHETLSHIPLAALGRALTAEERNHFAASRAVAERLSTASPIPPAARTALNHVLSSIEQRQTHNPARYRTLWAQVVGADAAQQSYLERIDDATATAWFRCVNSTLSYHLQRQPGLAQKLSRALGVPIRKLRS